MKSTNRLHLIIAGLLLMTISSCSVIGDIFQAGMGVGIFIVVIIIVLIIFIVNKIGKK